MLEFAEALGNAAAKTTSDLFKKTMEKALRKEAEKENKNRESKYSQSVSFTKKDLFGGN